jgi:Na+-transporting NADH:ubiquinone oxidoreductase subunit C
MSNNTYTVVFTLLMCTIISFTLAGTSQLLQERRVLNQQIDVQKNILNAAGKTFTSSDEIQDAYKKFVSPIFISKKGDIVTAENDSTLKIFKVVNKDDSTKIDAYVYRVLGKGLWSKLHGFLAVNSTGQQVIGLAFFAHGETPGLGAEIEKKWFCDNFVGKQLYKDNKLVGITVAKGKAKNHPTYKSMSNHIVDGISGATITSKGVEKMLSTDPLKYHNFFNK